MATVFLYELISNVSRTLCYSINVPNKKLIIRIDLALNKGRDSRVYLQGEDKRWILMLEDNYYEKIDNLPNKMQQNKIIAGEMTKEQAEQHNEQQKLMRRNEKLQFYFSCLEKIL